MNRNKALILAKVESVYGTDSVPTYSANAILAELPEFTPLGRDLERKNIKPYYGATASVAVGEGLQLSFATELRTGGALGTAPDIGVLFKGCGFTETVTPATSVVYDPNSDASGTSLSMYFYQHDILHKVLGARGSFTVDLKAGEYGTIKWTFQGIYAGPADTTIPAAPVFSTILPARFLSASFTIDSYAAVIAGLKIDVKTDVAKRLSANSSTGVVEHFIKDRSVSGEIDPEMVAIATKDFWTMWSGYGLVALTATVGTATGYKCTITAPKVQINMPKYADRDNILTLGMPLKFTPNSGNDELKFSFV